MSWSTSVCVAMRSALTRVSSRAASSSSLVRMPSSRSTSSSCRAADWAWRRTFSSRLRRLEISVRMRSRSERWAWTGVRATSATSASSAARGERREASGALALLAREFAQCMSGRLLLRFFLRRALAARGLRADLHLDHEPFVMIRPYLGHHVVVGQREPLRLRDFLQGRFVVLEEQILFVDRLDVLSERGFDHLARRIDSAVEIDRGDHRFEEIREQRVLPASARLLFADAEEDDLPHPVMRGLLRQARRADQIRLHLREGSFVERRKMAEEQIADDEAEHRIAEEFEGFVVADLEILRLVRVGLVGQRAPQQIAARECVPDALLELRDAIFHATRSMEQPIANGNNRGVRASLFT